MTFHQHDTIKYFSIAGKLREMKAVKFLTYFTMFAGKT